MGIPVSGVADTILKRQPDFVWQARVFVIYARVHPDKAASLLTVLRQRESDTQQLWQAFDMPEFEAIFQGSKTASRAVH
ncbi:hypothetical protein [Granulicella aggregans]|uniref:hypothetical protein n=1 Tax=Granulicella aggregans TaxID=474949 RepID=UPI0021DF7839|nr:hypothetical protein [Granulicella aggregans]